MIRFILAAAMSLVFSTAALAQSSPGLTYGQVPTAGQWNSYFAGKQDVLGYTPLNRAGGTMTGKLITSTPSAAGAGLNMAIGTAPTTPNNGDFWATTSGFYGRANGVTVGPFGSAVGTNSVTNANLAQAPTLTIKSNITGGTANESDNSLTSIIDAALGSTRGSVLYRGASSWAILAPGASGLALKSNGAGADPSYQSSGTGTVTSVTCGATVITTTGTCVTAGAIPGVATNSNAAAGNVGEYIVSNILQASSVSIPNNGTGANITSISLTAGDWDVQAMGYQIPPNGQTHNVSGCSISTTSATFNTASPNFNSIGVPFTAGGNIQGYSIGPIRISLASTTTYYLVCNLSATVATGAGFGQISGRRAR